MFSKTCNRFYPSRDLILLVIYLFISLRYVTVFVFSLLFFFKSFSAGSPWFEWCQVFSPLDFATKSQAVTNLWKQISACENKD